MSRALAVAFFGDWLLVVWDDWPPHWHIRLFNNQSKVIKPNYPASRGIFLAQPSRATHPLSCSIANVVRLFTLSSCFNCNLSLCFKHCSIVWEIWWHDILGALAPVANSPNDPSIHFFSLLPASHDSRLCKLFKVCPLKCLRVEKTIVRVTSCLF